jgi:hypothetical protein
MECAVCGNHIIDSNYGIAGEQAVCNYCLGLEDDISQESERKASERMSPEEIKESLEYFGAGKGLIQDVSTMSYAYVDSQNHPNTYFSAKTSEESGGDISFINPRGKFEKNEKLAIQSALSNPGVWFSYNYGKDTLVNSGPVE